MKRFYILLILCIFFSPGKLFAQATLPDFTLKNTNGKIHILWMNQYPLHVNGISIQRSYDSLKNFSSITSVLYPENTLNGYTDNNPPYPLMYYRLFIGFDDGAYLFTSSKRPELNSTIDYSSLIQEINALNEKHKQGKTGKAKKGTSSGKGKAEEPVQEDIIKYPSKWVFTNKNNNVVLKLPDLKTNKYKVKFFTEDNQSLFELKNVSELIIVEKVNFKTAGWFKFEIYRDELLFEENKFFIPRDLIKESSKPRSAQKF